MKQCASVYIMVLLAGFSVLQACHNKEQKRGVVLLDKDDTTFLALKDTAQSHLQWFIDDLADGAADSKYRYTIKSDFKQDTTHEHMWSRIVEYKNGYFIGVFADSAYYLNNINPGDSVKIKQTDVEDWSVYDKEHKTKYGNYSYKYLNSKKEIPVK